MVRTTQGRRRNESKSTISFDDQIRMKTKTSLTRHQKPMTMSHVSSKRTVLPQSQSTNDRGALRNYIFNSDTVRLEQNSYAVNCRRAVFIPYTYVCICRYSIIASTVKLIICANDTQLPMKRCNACKMIRYDLRSFFFLSYRMCDEITHIILEVRH